ncbi:MAG TPA: metallophosphoesterase [Nitrospirota bacterium]
MSLFFLFIFLIYGGVHAYAFLRARIAFAFGYAAGAVLAAFMLLMVLAPALIRALEQYDYEVPARALSYLAYFWMAALFLFFCGSVVLDIVNLVIRAAGWLTRSGSSSYLIPGGTSFLISLGLSLAVCIYGYFEALNIRTERVRVETAKLPPNLDRLTIAQITDVHLGMIIRSDRLEKMLEAVKAAKPDIFISTGDLVDAQINHMVGLAELLRGVKTKYGSYAITGNHEYYAGLDKSLAFTKEAGFTVLQNQTVSAGPINLAGVDDRTAVLLKLEKPISERELLSGLPHGRFTLFLKHQPRIDKSTIGLFDLQISGHTHKGQIFPFTLLTRFFFPLNAGTYDLGSGSLLHVSRGTGTWGPPIRFLAPPEVTIYEIVRKTTS